MKKLFKVLQFLAYRAAILLLILYAWTHRTGRYQLVAIGNHGLILLDTQNADLTIALTRNGWQQAPNPIDQAHR